jgi:plasmid maintenance system antidote protein VapI
MTLSERICIILREQNLNQRRFAESIFVTEGYISRVLKNGLGMSKSTALLIEKIHGYSKDWVLHGTEPKKLVRESGELSCLQKKLIEEIELMNDEDLFFIHTYIETLKKKKKSRYKDQGGS